MSRSTLRSSPPDLNRGSMWRAPQVPAGPMDCRVKPGNDEFVVGPRLSSLTTTKRPSSLPDLIGQSSNHRWCGSISGARGDWMPRSSRSMTQERGDR